MIVSKKKRIEHNSSCSVTNDDGNDIKDENKETVLIDKEESAATPQDEQTSFSITINCDKSESNVPEKFFAKDSHQLLLDDLNLDITDYDFADRAVSGSFFVEKIYKYTHICSFYGFKLKYRDIELMVGKTGGILMNRIYIGKFPTVCIKDKIYDYIIDTCSKKNSFILTNNSKNVLLKLAFSSDYGGEIGPRIVTAVTESGDWSSVLPKRKPSGAWEINLGGKFYIPSPKNCIIVDRTSKEILSVRKIGKHLIQIDVSSPVCLRDIFAFGIATFLYHE